MLFLEKVDVYFIETMSLFTEKFHLRKRRLKLFFYILKKLVYEKVWDFFVVPIFLGSVLQPEVILTPKGVFGDI